MNEVEAAYRSLLEEYGKQGWWPAESRFEVVVGAVLTQNTNWRNVERAIANLKDADRLSPEAVLDAKKEELEQLIRPSGFYRQKAGRLKLAAAKWLEVRSSRLGTMGLREEWLSVKGIGRETADSILLYAMDRPIFVIDAYTRRFCASWFSKGFRDYDEYRSFFEDKLPRDIGIYKEYHALIVKWGKGASLSHRADREPS